VLKAVEELGYRPNRIARSLRMNKTLTLGLVVPDSANPFFAELSNAVEDAAFAAGFTLLIGNSAEDLQRQGTYLESFIDHRVDGLFLVPAEGTAAVDVRAVGKRAPLVILDRFLPGVDAPQVVVDNTDSASRATDHLLKHGRRRIACIAGPPASNPSDERVEGFMNAVRAGTGKAATTRMVRHGAFGRRAGYVAAQELIQQEEVDALFVTSDEQAIGVLRAIAETGLRCPEDIALVSFDGIAASAYTVPAVTCMAQPIDALGRAALDAMNMLINDPATAPVVTRLSTRLVRRGSCGCDDPPGGDVATPAEDPLTRDVAR